MPLLYKHPSRILLIHSHLLYLYVHHIYLYSAPWHAVWPIYQDLHCSSFPKNKDVHNNVVLFFFLHQEIAAFP